MMSASLRKGTAESKSQQLKLSMFHWFFVGLLPLILLVIFANIIDRNVLSSIISNLISMIPEEKVETDFVPNINNSPPNQMIVKVKSKMERQQTMMTSNSHGTSTTTSTRSSNNINQEENNSSTTKIKTSSSNTPTSTGKQDKAHTIDQNINQLRSDYRSDVNNMHKALNLADALRHRDLIKHDGGSLQKEAIKTYKKAIKLIIKERNRVLSSGGDIRLSKHGRFENTAEEMFFSNEDKSIQILLVSTYCSLGKQYFMANMFEKAVGAYDAALKLEEGYIDALNSRASASLILGKYHEAGSDYEKVLSLDQGNLLTEVFTGLTKVLIAKEEAVSSGWDTMIGLLNELIPSQEKMISNLQGDSSDEIRGRNMLSNRLVSSQSRILYFQ
jgi:tetratricopeptide (TPR) repeat protein